MNAGTLGKESRFAWTERASERKGFKYSSGQSRVMPKENGQTMGSAG